MANTKSLSFTRATPDYAYISDANLSSGFPGKDDGGSTGDFTLEGWAYFNSIPNPSSQTFIDKGTTASEKSFKFYYYKGATSELTVRIYNDGTTAEEQTVAWSPSTETWYHVAMVYDASAGDITVYVDGSQVGDVLTGFSNSIFLGTSQVNVGALATGSDAFDGLLDEWIVWSEERSSTQIAASYNSGNGNIYAGSEGMDAYWRFEDNLLDETSNNNDLTHSGTASYSSTIPFSGASVGGFMTLNTSYWGA